MPTKTVDRRLEGYLHQDCFGRLHIDRCATDAEHMAAEAPPGEERRTCRTYFDRLVPEGTIGKKGRWMITITFLPDNEEE